jgi:ubiquinone/menaquinone biosynthesis C-methylase UbiE
MKLALMGVLFLGIAAQEADPKPPPYETREKHDPNGIGKFYLGREIAHVMGHQAAGWLERPEREQEEEPRKVIEALELKPGQVVADVGVGTGYFAFRMAPHVGEKGKVLGVDIQPEMLDLLRAKAAKLGVKNVEGVLGTVKDPKLPEGGVDLVLMVDVYHEFDHPWEMMQAIKKSLKPGGRVVLVEYRKEDPTVPIKEVHKMSEEQIKKEMAVVGLEHVKTVGTLPRQHIVIFRKK